MADETVKFTKGNDATFAIKVDKPSIKLEKLKTIKFVNDLNPKGDIHIQFFKTPAKKFGSPPEPMTNFGEVGGNPIGNTLNIPKDEHRDCTITGSVQAGDQILYGVTVDNTPGSTTYAPLDPVVIIDGPNPEKEPQKPGINPLLVPVAALAGLVIGYAIWG